MAMPSPAKRRRSQKRRAFGAKGLAALGELSVPGVVADEAWPGVSAELGGAAGDEARPVGVESAPDPLRAVAHDAVALGMARDALVQVLLGFERVVARLPGGPRIVIPRRWWQPRQKLCSSWQLWHFPVCIRASIGCMLR